MEDKNHNGKVANGHTPTEQPNGYPGYTPAKEQNGHTPVENGETPLLEKDPEKYDLGKDTSVILTNTIDLDSQGAMSEESLPTRDQWSSKVDFVLSVVGFAVGLGNVWRFPYLCYKNGGGAFLIPYLIALICGGVPVFFVEIALGQYMSRGGILCWDIAPICKGIGICTMVIVFYLNVYYIVILAWDVYYMFMAFSSTLPWSHCNNTWNTERCGSSFNGYSQQINTTVVNGTDGSTTYSSIYGVMSNFSSANITNITTNITTVNFTRVDPVIEFWENKILKISSGIDQPGGIVWELALALLFVWILCYFCVWKGVKWTGKVVYFTATFPYVMLTVLLIRGVTLPGASEGIIFYLKPNFSKLADSQVWIDAGTQIFFSYALSLGAMTALGSYNKFTNNCYKDCVLISTLNSLTSLFAGFVVFSVLGFMAGQQGVPVSEVAESGPGLAFIAYPKAVTQMPFSPLWAILFFFMIVLLGLDSQFVGMEAFITVFCDSFPCLMKKWRRETFIAIYAAISFLVGLTMCTRGGMYVFQLFDYYSASGMALLWASFFEAIAVSWVFGHKKFTDAIELMIGYRIPPILEYSLAFLTPFLTAFIFIFMWVQHKPLMYNNTYEYPPWALGLGMCLSFSSMICIPIYAIYALGTTPGTLRQRWKKLTTPNLRPHQIAPHWPEAQTLKTGKEKETRPLFKETMVKLA